MRRRTLLLILVLALTGCAAVAPDGRPEAYHYQMGLSYLGEQNYTAALKELRESEKLSPRNPELQYYLGRVYRGKQRPDLAVVKFLRAIDLKPDYSIARNDLGVTYMELKQWDKAIEQFRIVKDDLLYEEHTNSVINLGLAYLGKGDYAKALAELEAARVNNPGNPIVKVAIGRVLAAQGQMREAVAEYRGALKVYPEYAMAHYYLGIALMKNDLAAARNEFREVVRLAPDTEFGKSAHEYLNLLR